MANRWMMILMQDQHVGYAHMRVVRSKHNGGKRYTTHMNQEYAIKRGRAEMRIRVEQKITENEAGRVLSFTREMKQGPVNQKRTGTLEDGKWIVVSGTGSSKVRQAVDPLDVLGPWAAEEVSRSRGYKPGTKYSLSVFSAQSPTREVTATVEIGGKEAKKIGEIKKWLHRVEVQLSIMPGMDIVEWVDRTGRVWMTQTTMGPLELRMKRCNKRAALQPRGEAAEIMVITAITPDKPIPRPRQVSQMRITLAAEKADDGSEGTLDFKLPDTSGQTIRRQPGKVIVTVRKVHVAPGKSYKRPYSEGDMDRYLQESPWLEINDDRIRRMSRQAVGKEENALKAAKKIEQYVGKVIREKNLGVGFATAAETARQKAGDCTEHALLAAALARAAGIPSRVVSGLVYGGPLPGDNKRRFYFHMWTELYVGEWMPIDAALGTFDGTHVAISHSDLARPNAVTDVQGEVMGSIGDFSVGVDEIRHGRRNQ